MQSLNTHVQDVCLATACKMKNVDEVISISLKKENLFPFLNIPPWHPLTLAHGFPGLICLSAEMNRFFPDQGWDKVLHQYVEKLVEEIKTKRIQDSSLFSGLTGICFSIDLASQESGAYSNLFLKLHNRLLQEVDSIYLEPLRKAKRQKEKFPPRLYDLISGISGVLTYLLRHADREDTRSIVLEMLALLVDLTAPFMMKEESFPGWFIPPEHSLKKEAYPQGHFDTGLAHGIAGCLVILAKARLKGIEVHGQKSAMRRIISWLQGMRCNIGEFKNVWPACIGVQHTSREYRKMDPKSYRDGWCYGAPGIAFSLFIAAHALKDEDLLNYAVNAMTDVCIRFFTQNTLVCPSFCHGLAGLLAIVHQMHLATELQVFSETANKISYSILERYSENHPFGFKTVNRGQGGQESILDNIGLIDGSIGIILSLLFHQSQRSSPWVQTFLLE